jgi:hypothetical protein
VVPEDSDVFDVPLLAEAVVLCVVEMLSLVAEVAEVAVVEIHVFEEFEVSDVLLSLVEAEVVDPMVVLDEAVVSCVTVVLVVAELL